MLGGKAEITSKRRLCIIAVLLVSSLLRQVFADKTEGGRRKSAAYTRVLSVCLSSRPGLQVPTTGGDTAAILFPDSKKTILLSIEAVIILINQATNHHGDTSNEKENNLTEEKKPKRALPNGYSIKKYLCRSRTPRPRSSIHFVFYSDDCEETDIQRA